MPVCLGRVAAGGRCFQSLDHWFAIAWSSCPTRVGRRGVVGLLECFLDSCSFNGDYWSQFLVCPVLPVFPSSPCEQARASASSDRCGVRAFLSQQCNFIPFDSILLSCTTNHPYSSPSPMPFDTFYCFLPLTILSCPGTARSQGLHPCNFEGCPTFPFPAPLHFVLPSAPTVAPTRSTFLEIRLLAWLWWTLDLRICFLWLGFEYPPSTHCTLKSWPEWFTFIALSDPSGPGFLALVNVSRSLFQTAFSGNRLPFRRSPLLGATCCCIPSLAFPF